MISLRKMVASLVFAAVCCGFLPGALAQSVSKPGPFEPEIVAYEKKDAASAPTPGGVVFVGSSSFRMWKDLETSFPGVNVINRGFGGSELSDSVKYADRIVIPYNPAMVVIYAGDNDIAAGKSPETVCADFVSLATAIRNALPDAKIAFLSIKPSIARWALVDKIKDANRQIKAYARKQKGMTFIDIFPQMLNEEGEPRPELYREDGLHPTAECYRLWQKIIAPYLKPYKTKK